METNRKERTTLSERLGLKYHINFAVFDKEINRVSYEHMDGIFYTYTLAGLYET